MDQELKKALQRMEDEEHKQRVELYKDIFSEKLRTLREERNYTQKTIAKKLGIPVSTYANWEQGRREPSIYDIFNIMSVYEIEANELFDITDLMQ